MSRRWAVSLRPDEAAVTARLRQQAHLEICEDSGRVWLRGPWREDLTDQVAGLPAGDRFQVLDDDQLVPWNARVPRGRLPAGPWQPLAAWFQFELPQAGLSAPLPQPTPLELVRDLEERPPNFLIASLDVWRRYCDTAPQERLDRWAFAADASGRALIRGEPAPPLPGERLVESDGILIAAGWRWSPPVEAAVLRQLLDLQAGELALLRSGGAFELIRSEEFVRATRSAVRHTADQFAAESPSAAGGAP